MYFGPDFGGQLSGYLRELDLNVTAETGDVYHVTVKAMNGAGAWSPVVSSRPIHVYGQNTPGTVYDGRKVGQEYLGLRIKLLWGSNAEAHNKHNCRLSTASNLHGLKVCDFD